MVSTNARKNIPNARDRILKAAAAVFADRNFDAARVDQIAAEAGVTKSLIYYHFKSKEDILDALLNRFFSDMENIVNGVFSGDMNVQDPGQLFLQQYYRFLQDNEDLVRVAMTESLKKGNSEPPMLRLLDGFIKIKSTVNPDGNYSSPESLSATLFFSLVPSAMLICLGDQFSERYGLMKDSISAIFSKQFAAAVSVLFDRR